MNKQQRREIIEERLALAVMVIEQNPEIKRAVAIRARLEGRTLFEQVTRSAMEALSADLKFEGWKIGNTYDSATWQPPAGTRFKSN